MNTRKDFKEVARIAPFCLTGAERSWVDGAGEPYRYDKWMTKLTDERKKELDERFNLVDDVFLEMDSHGVNQHLCVFKDKIDGNLYAFQYGTSSEEAFYSEWSDLEGDDRLSKNRPIFEVDQTTRTVVDYVHPEGEKIEAL